MPLKTGVISVVERAQYDHTLGSAWSTDGSAEYASVRNRPKTDAVWPVGKAEVIVAPYTAVLLHWRIRPITDEETKLF